MQLTAGASLYVLFRCGLPSALVGDYLPNKKRQQFNLLVFALLGQVDLFSSLRGVLRTLRVFHADFLFVSDGQANKHDHITHNWQSSRMTHYIVNSKQYCFFVPSAVTLTISYAFCAFLFSTSSTGILTIPWRTII